MQELIHNKVKTIAELIDTFNQAQKRYAERSYQFEEQFALFLNKLSGYFGSRGESARESEVLRIINMLQAVKRGFDPSKMERLRSGKRELLWGYFYVAIENVNVLLQEIYHKETAKLEEGDEILSNLILNLVQQEFLTNDMLRELDSISRIELFWNTLLTRNGTLSVINRKLHLSMITEDIYLLLEKIISRINTQ
ncbi:MAG: hypothetical protein GX042_06380 [Bacteroidales bacterium]|jgi:molybdopterin converting factor small subunit|nr:hypothetical protein [Bacteroidales bacterium]